MRLVFCCVVLVLLGAACGGSVEEQATPVGPTPTSAAAAFLTPTADVQPVQFPHDEAPHDVLTEWWYYTGHLVTADGSRYGFEFVFFQADRAGFPTGYASHFAVTDSQRDSFHYDQRIGMAASAPADQGFALSLGDWSMTGANGVDQLHATMAGYTIDLTLSALKPAVLHGGDGFLSLGDIGDSYYYSRTRMQVSGTLEVDDATKEVSGQAWMDHQWGNFIAVGEGGWDWYSLQLSDGTELMLYIVRDEHGVETTMHGTLVNADGTSVDLDADDLLLAPTGFWTSPHSGTTYPQGWSLHIADVDLTLSLTPTLADQELDTRLSTGVIYWEGEVEATGTRDGAPVNGVGYVELTGYAD